MATSTMQLPSCFQTTWITSVSKSYTSSTSSQTITQTQTKTGGWYPLGCVGYGHGYANVRSAGVKITSRSIGEVQVEWKIMRDNSTSTSATIRADILWIKV